MSAMQASVSRERNSEPTTLAAGPERMVSTGYSSARLESIREPSPLTTISGAWMPRSTHHPADRPDQVAQQGDEPGVQGGGQRPARGVQVAGQLVAAGHRQSAVLTHEPAHRVLVRRVAHREVARDGEGRHAPGMAPDGLQRGGLVQRGGFVARRVVASAHQHDRVAAQGLPQAGLLEHVGGVADQDQADGAALPLHDGIGGQGRGQGDQLHGPARQSGGQHVVHGLADAQGQVVPGGQGLGGSGYPFGWIEEDRVGVGSSRIDAKQHRASS